MSKRTANIMYAISCVLIAVAYVLIFTTPVCRHGDCDDAYILVKDDAVTPLWGYQQLPMKDCAWCHRTVNLNRHHVVPQSANPALRDVKENLIVLCRDCHFVLGHRCNWRRYNPDVLYICTHFTNCVKSADTRYDITNVVERLPQVPRCINVYTNVNPERTLRSDAR